MAIIGLCGKRKSGKKTVAELMIYIAETFELKIRRVSFADMIRSLFSKETGIGLNMMLDINYKEEFKEKLLDFAEKKRKENPHIFINMLFETLYEGEHIIIDDVRTIEELQALLNVGGKPYKIEVQKEIRRERGFKYTPKLDDSILEVEIGDLTSETFYTLGGGRIFNNKPLNQLKLELIPIVQKEFLGLKV